MLYYFHRLAANCVCVPFGTGQVVYSWFLKISYENQLPAAAQSTTVSVDVNQKQQKLWPGKPKQ